MKSQISLEVMYSLVIALLIAALISYLSVKSVSEYKKFLSSQDADAENASNYSNGFLNLCKCFIG